MKFAFNGLCLAAAALALLFYPQITAAAASEGAEICMRAILPNLFPFIVLTNLLLDSGYAQLWSNLAQPLMQRIFHLPGASATVLFNGLLGGYPVGAQTVAALYAQKALDRDSAERVLAFSNNAGPAFIFGIAGAGLFHSVFIGAVLYTIHVLSAFLTGVIVRPHTCRESRRLSPPVLQNNLLRLFPNAVRKAGETTVQVCFFVVLFRIITAFSTCLIRDPWLRITLSGILELSGGTTSLRMSELTAVTKFCIISCLLGWGGVCVHTQTLSILKQAGLGARRYLTGKLLQSVISLLIAALLVPALPLSAACFNLCGVKISNTYAFLPIIAILCFTLLLKITSGKAANNRL